MMTKMEYQPVPTDHSVRSKRKSLLGRLTGFLIAVAGDPDESKH